MDVDAGGDAVAALLPRDDREDVHLRAGARERGSERPGIGADPAPARLGRVLLGDEQYAQGYAPTPEV